MGVSSLYQWINTPKNSKTTFFSTTIQPENCIGQNYQPMAKKKYRVIIRVEKEYTRIVSAKSEHSAELQVRRKIASKPIKITTRNFERFPSIFEL
jgi:hypothetical protein